VQLVKFCHFLLLEVLYLLLSILELCVDGLLLSLHALLLVLKVADVKLNGFFRVIQM